MYQSLIEQSGKVSWIASLMTQLLDEVRVAPLGVAARIRVAEIHDRSVSELEQGLALEVVDELEGNMLPFGDKQHSDAMRGVARDRRLSRVDRLRLSRVDRLLHTIETAQSGQQMLAQQRKQGRAGVGAEVEVRTAPDRFAQMRGIRAEISHAVDISPVLGISQADDLSKAPDISRTPEIPPGLGDLVKDFVRMPESSPPAGSVALDFACDRHAGRLMRLWMSRKGKGVTFGGEGPKGAWHTDTRGRGAVVVTCTRRDCRYSVRLTNDCLVERLRQVRADFEAGRGLSIAWFPLTGIRG